MPVAAPHPCAYPGCNVLLSQGSRYCLKHHKAKQKSSDDRRMSSSERGYTGAWQKARRYYLQAHPLCRQHEAQGRIVAASVVDHIKPHKGDKALFWDSSNWQPLCKHCHDSKTAQEDGGFGS